MEELILKNVRFYDSIINTAMDNNGNVYIDIFQTAKAIGLGNVQANAQAEKCKNDILLHKGYREFELGAFNPRYVTYALESSYITIWLLKITLYRKTIEFVPEIPKRLSLFQNELEIAIQDSYQNVMLKKEHEIISPKKRGRPLNKDIDLLNEIKAMHQRIDGLYFDFNKFVNFMNDWRNDVQDMIELYDVVMDNIAYFTNKEQKKWKNHIYEMVDKLVQLNNTFESRIDVLKNIYLYMNKNYGICWDQEYKDFMHKNNTNMKPTTIDVICQNEMYRSIFESILEDKLSECGIELEELESTEDNDKENVEFDKYANLDKLIKPLAEKYNDNSLGSTSTYRKVYNQMATVHKVSWKNHITRYQNENGATKLPSKRDLILMKPALLEKFEKSVQELLNRETNENKIMTNTEDKVEVVVIEQ